MLGDSFCFAFAVSEETEIRNGGKWRVVELSSEPYLPGEESFIVIIPGCANRIVGWIVCLDDDPSRRSPPPSPASYLGEQLKGCFSCSEIRPIER